SPWMRCPTMTRGLQVSGPSVASVHAGPSPRSNARSVEGVRSRTAIPSVRSNSIVRQQLVERDRILANANDGGVVHGIRPRGGDTANAELRDALRLHRRR